MFKAIIIDNDGGTRRIVAEMLGCHFPGIEVVSQSATFSQGVRDIECLRPDLVFTDIELPDGKGYEIYNCAFSWPVCIVFITADAHHAIKVINHSPAGFLLKPLSAPDFTATVLKALKQLQYAYLDKPLPQNINFPNRQLVFINTTDYVYFISKKEIVRCEADGNYTRIYCEGESKALVASQTLGQFEAMLPYPLFLRVHQSHLVNTEYIKYIDKKRCELVMTNGSVVSMSQRKKGKVFEFIENNRSY